jgi:nitroimidazol reductase NimA-like FMN-containing flavoprotein (pyridoxamine 5'-phosphate oxidase superfamily)
VTEMIPPTARTRVRRLRERGSYQRAVIDAILDEGMICHVAAYVEGTPLVLPTAYARRGDELLLHGAAGNHLLKAACDGAELCVAVTLVDGLVLARSTFHHSINYRSVVLFGQGAEVTEPADKAAALEAIVEHLLPGRTREARAPTPAELRQTRVVRVPVSEASAKVRTGPPVDDEADLGLAVWAGVLPLRTVAGPPQPDPITPADAVLPAGVLQPERWRP